MIALRSHVLLFGAVAVSTACGSMPSPALPPPPAPVASGSVSSSSSAAPPAPPVPSDGAPAPAAMGNNTPIRPSALLAEVKKLGIDTTKPLSAIPLQIKKQLMPLFKQALGYESCSGCHIGNDYDKPTRNKEITRKMWEKFLVGMRDAQGGGLFCDSCHGGRAKSLDRTAMEGVQRLMETDYVTKLARADKQPHDCTACHGKEPEPKIIEKLWGIAAK
jgi:hypothetical protein